MEKRHTKTLTRTLRLGSACAKTILIGVLFIPGFLGTQNLRRAQQPDRDPLNYSVIKPRPKELVKIYYILKTNRPDILDSEAWKVSETILHQCSGYGLDPMLVLAVIDVESKFQSTMVSPSGARGIMQILPDTGKALVQEVGWVADGQTKIFRPEILDDPILNIKLGIYYLQDLKKNFRSLSTALIAYNLGPTELKNRMDNDIAYSDDYANLVFASYQKYKKTKQPTF